LGVSITGKVGLLQGEHYRCLYCRMPALGARPIQFSVQIVVPASTVLIRGPDVLMLIHKEVMPMPHLSDRELGDCRSVACLFRGERAIMCKGDER
jgi:hypothetical protein